MNRKPARVFFGRHIRQEGIFFGRLVLPDWNGGHEGIANFARSAFLACCLGEARLRKGRERGEKGKPRSPDALRCQGLDRLLGRQVRTGSLLCTWRPINLLDFSGPSNKILWSAPKNPYM